MCEVTHERGETRIVVPDRGPPPGWRLGVVTGVGVLLVCLGVAAVVVLKRLAPAGHVAATLCAVTLSAFVYIGLTRAQMTPRRLCRRVWIDISPEWIRVRWDGSQSVFEETMACIHRVRVSALRMPWLDGRRAAMIILDTADGATPLLVHDIAAAERLAEEISKAAQVVGAVSAAADAAMRAQTPARTRIRVMCEAENRWRIVAPPPNRIAAAAGAALTGCILFVGAGFAGLAIVSLVWHGFDGAMLVFGLLGAAICVIGVHWLQKSWKGLCTVVIEGDGACVTVRQRFCGSAVGRSWQLGQVNVVSVEEHIDGWLGPWRRRMTLRVASSSSGQQSLRLLSGYSAAELEWLAVELRRRTGASMNV